MQQQYFYLKEIRYLSQENNIPNWRTEHRFITLRKLDGLLLVHSHVQLPSVLSRAPRCGPNINGSVLAYEGTVFCYLDRCYSALQHKEV